MNIQKENSHTDKTKSRYVFAQKGNADYSSIKLTEGKFKDVIYHYGNVSFAPEENTEESEVSLDELSDAETQSTDQQSVEDTDTTNS